MARGRLPARPRDALVGLGLGLEAAGPDDDELHLLSELLQALLGLLLLDEYGLENVVDLGGWSVPGVAGADGGDDDGS